MAIVQVNQLAGRGLEPDRVQIALLESGSFWPGDISVHQ